MEAKLYALSSCILHPHLCNIIYFTECILFSAKLLSHKKIKKITNFYKKLQSPKLQIEMKSVFNYTEVRLFWKQQSQ